MLLNLISIQGRFNVFHERPPFGVFPNFGPELPNQYRADETVARLSNCLGVSRVDMFHHFNELVS